MKKRSFLLSTIALLSVAACGAFGAGSKDSDPPPPTTAVDGGADSFASDVVSIPVADAALQDVTADALDDGGLFCTLPGVACSGPEQCCDIGGKDKVGCATTFTSPTLVCCLNEGVDCNLVADECCLPLTCTGGLKKKCMK